MTSHQHHQREQTTMTSQWNTPSNPDLRFASESESGFTTNLNLDSDKSKQSGKQITTPWLSVWSEAQTCIWPSWCHCHSLSLASLKSRLVLPFWYRLTWVVPEKGPLNWCVCVCTLLILNHHRSTADWTVWPLSHFLIISNRELCHFCTW